MSIATDVLAILGEAAGGFRGCGLKREMTPYDTSPEVLIAEWAAAGGWIARESQVISAPSNIAAADHAGAGQILEAELCLDGKTLQIRRLPGRWLATVIEETEGDEFLADERLVVTVKHGTARYRRYWNIPTDGAADVIACRLTGFEAQP